MTLYAVRRDERWKPQTIRYRGGVDSEDHAMCLTTTASTFLAASVWPTHPSAFMWRSAGETMVVLFGDEADAVSLILSLGDGSHVVVISGHEISYAVAEVTQEGEAELDRVRVGDLGFPYPTIVSR